MVMVVPGAPLDWRRLCLRRTRAGVMMLMMISHCSSADVKTSELQ